jgi:DNA-binding transcriptional ArsR family regulator
MVTTMVAFDMIPYFWKYRIMLRSPSKTLIDSDATLRALRALGHASRLSAYRALIQVGPDGLAVGALRERLDLPPATLSAHLNVLRAAGLVNDAREGRTIRVRADYARMNALIGYLTENCCAGAPCGPGGVCAPTKPARRKKQPS